MKKLLIFSGITIGVMGISFLLIKQKKVEKKDLKPNWETTISHRGIGSDYIEDFDIKVYSEHHPDSALSSHMLTKKGKEYHVKGNKALKQKYEELLTPQTNEKVLTIIKGYLGGELERVDTIRKFAK